MGVLRKHGRNLPGGQMGLRGVKNVLNEVHLYKLSLARNIAFQGYALPGLLRNNLLSSFPFCVIC